MDVQLNDQLLGYQLHPNPEFTHPFLQNSGGADHDQQCFNLCAGLTYRDPTIFSMPSNNDVHKNSDHLPDHDQCYVFGAVLPGTPETNSPSPAASSVFHEITSSMSACRGRGRRRKRVLSSYEPQEAPNAEDRYNGLLLGGEHGSNGVQDHNFCYYYDYGATGTMLGFNYPVQGEACKASNSAEKQRRGQMSEKFLELKSLIPNQTKKDRASIVEDAANYIQELLRTVDELRTLVQRKQYSNTVSPTECNKKRQVTLLAEEPEDWGSSSTLVGSLRSSWIQRKSKSTSVDVRIVEDEVNIRLTQRRRGPSCCCYLSVAEVLQFLGLEPLQLASGNIGDCYTFMINSKIPKDSDIYASAIATKFMEEMTTPLHSSL